MKALFGEFRLYFIIGLLALAGVGAYFFAQHERNVGAAGVQAKWDAAKAADAELALHASESARKTEHQQADAFSSITSSYLQDTSHEYPSIADTLPAAVDAGTLRLRDACPAPDSGSVPRATARSRAADAAATQALADRVEASIAAVRAGDQADARERQLGAQVIALQALLRAERAPVE